MQTGELTEMYHGSWTSRDHVHGHHASVRRQVRRKGSPTHIHKGIPSWRHHVWGVGTRRKGIVRAWRAQGRVRDQSRWLVHCETKTYAKSNTIHMTVT